MRGKASRLQAWLEQELLEVLEGRIPTIDVAVARRSGADRGDCAVHRLTVVTRMLPTSSRWALRSLTRGVTLTVDANGREPIEGEPWVGHEQRYADVAVRERGDDQVADLAVRADRAHIAVSLRQNLRTGVTVWWTMDCDAIIDHAGPGDIPTERNLVAARIGARE